MSGILALKASRVVYVSCDVATLGGDLRRFLDEGYRLGHVEAFDFFPGTAHVETLVTLVQGKVGQAEAYRFSAAATKASNSARNSPVRQKFSGCHWTARQNRDSGRSIPSTTPSGAVARDTESFRHASGGLMVTTVHVEHLAVA